MARRGSGSLVGPFTLSAIFHAAIATLLFVSLKQQKPVALPPMYRVNIVAAPPGERAIGEVSPAAAKPTTSVTQPAAAQSSIQEAAVPKRSTAKAVSAPTVAGAKKSTGKAATPTEGKSSPAAKVTKATDAKVNQAKTAAPKAGGGPIGGKGTDVATVRSEGIEFPFPGYLNNIVRQIAIRFKPRNPAARLKAEVRFLIHRDGSVSDIKFVRASGNFGFDLEARGAVEAASSALAFGPLPDGFSDDALPVVFSFDPEFLK